MFMTYLPWTDPIPGAMGTNVAKQTKHLFFWLLQSNVEWVKKCTNKYKLQGVIGTLKGEYKKPGVCVTGGHGIILESHYPAW